MEAAWREAPIAWLCGVRRSGKTTLAESLGSDHALYINCDLPTAEDMIVSPSGAPGYVKQFGSHSVRVCTPTELLPPP